MLSKKKETGLTRAHVKELVETMVRKALGTQARELEEHLTAIHNRLVELERRSPR